MHIYQARRNDHAIRFYNISAFRVEIFANYENFSKGIASIGVIPRALFLLGYTLENSLAFNLAGKGIVLVIGCGHQTIELILERVQKHEHCKYNDNH